MSPLSISCILFPMSFSPSKEQHFKMTCQLKQMKEELPTLLKENEELTGLVAEAKGELNLLERRAKFLPMAKVILRMFIVFI